MSDYDIVIAGNGIIAYATAYELSQRDSNLKVAVVGPQHRNGSATFASGAMLSCFGELTNQTFKSLPGRTKFEMARESFKMWPEWLKSINSHFPSEKPLKITYGTYIILNGSGGNLDTDNFSVILESLKKYEEPFEEVCPKDIKELNPRKDARPLRSLFIPGEGCISPHQVLFSLEKILQKQQSVTLIPEEVREVIVESGRAKGVRTADNQNIKANKVMIAAGAFSQKILDSIPEIRSTTPKILCGVGYSLLIDQNPDIPFKHVIRTPNRAGACGLHALPRENKKLYIGATNDLFFEPNQLPRLGMLNFVIDCALNQIDESLTDSKLTTCYVGNRPASVDTFPLIGSLSIQNLFIASGTYRDGFHDSPLIAKDMALRLMGDQGIISEIFRPQRPLIQINNIEQAIEENTLHFEAASYEHKVHLPHAHISEKLYLSIARKRNEELYHTTGIKFGLTPDFAFLLERCGSEKMNEKKLKEFIDYLANAPFKQAEK